MARVRTFSAWRYARPTTDITPVVAPPYDVIGPELRASLASQDPHNVVELELPEGPLDPEAEGNRYEHARSTWDTWRDAGVLKRDAAPRLYVLEQRFDQDGKPVRRRAFIVEVGLERFEAGIILPHERTLPKALGDRFEMIKATKANLSPVFGLYDDPDLATREMFDAATAADPVATATDADGVETLLWACDDETLGRRLTQFMADRKVFIADGHHRYTTALAYRDLRRTQDGHDAHAPDPAYDYVMMALVNMDDPDLVVLPYNRVATGIDFDADSFKAGLAEWFDLTELPPGHPSRVLEDSDRTAFLIKTRADERPFLAALRDDVDVSSAIPVDASEAWKSLDVAVLQELVLWPLLGIHPDRPQTLDRLRFTKDAHEAFRATEDNDVAFALRPTRLSQLRDVSLAGEIMPQKSTYFYPKLLSGTLFRSAE